MDYQQTQTDQNSSSKTVYIAVVIVAIIAIAFWYIYGMQSLKPLDNTQPISASDQEQIPPLSNDNTTTDILNDLNQTPDYSDALNKDAASSVQDIQNF